MTYIPEREAERTIKSSKNSTKTPLLTGETFTGEWEQIETPSIMVSAECDKEGTLYIDFSNDGINPVFTATFNYYLDRINAPHVFEVGSRWTRVRFENTSGEDQTKLFITASYGLYNKLTSPLNGLVAENYDATIVRPTDYKGEVASGKRQGRSLWNKFGYNNSVPIGTEVLASFGGTFTPLTTATTLNIVSTSALDTDGGTGCNTIVIYGIDENRDEKIELVTLNGTTPIVTASNWLGINRVVMFLCGSTTVNQGDINITATTGGAFMAQMPALGGVTQQCIFHIPRNYSFNAEYLFINVLNRGKNAIIEVRLWVYSAVSNGKQEVFKLDIDTTKTSEPVQVNPSLPFPITEKTVVWIEATSDKADVILNGRLSGILERVQ